MSAHVAIGYLLAWVIGAGMSGFYFTAILIGSMMKAQTPQP